MKKILSIFIVFCLCLALFIGCNQSIPVNVTPISTPSPTAQPTPTPNPEKRVKYSATGDNLIHGMIYMQAANRAVDTDKNYDFDFLYENMKDFYKNFDMNFINQETLVNSTYPASTYPCFSTPGELAKSAYDAGFRVFTQSNNHTYDLGLGGLSATKEFWDSMPSDVLNAGIYNDENLYTPIVQNVNGINIAYVAYTQHTNGIPTPANSKDYVVYTSELEIIQKQIEIAKDNADFVVVSVHWGNEDSHIIADYQKTLAQQMVDFGADVIIGTHPHVIQGAEWITSTDGTKKAFCAYSLGNFVSAQSKPSQMLGCILTFDFVVNDNIKTIENVHLNPVINHYGAGYSDIQAYLLKDYTEQLAQSHGVRGNYPTFGMDYILNTYNEYIPSEFLVLENN